LNETDTMTLTDAEIIITIAAQAAVADGNRNATELAQISAAATRLGLSNADAVVERASRDHEDVRTLSASLSTDEARRAAYEIAVAVCNADGVAGAKEIAFLQELSATLGTGPGTAEMSAIASAATLTGHVLPPPVPSWRLLVPSWPSPPGLWSRHRARSPSPSGGRWCWSTPVTGSARSTSERTSGSPPPPPRASSSALSERAC